MKDRVPVNPGRVLIKPENGSSAYYATMTRADNPTQKGTPLNKASLLKDATAAKFGLGAAAVPDDVLALIPDLIAGRAQVATGSYTGTGTYGESNPCSLTFDFAPKIVIITQSSGLYPEDGHWGSDCFIWTYGQTKVYKIAFNITSYITCSLSGNTLSWYHGSQSIDGNKRASGQCNVSGAKYLYLAIG